MMILPEEEQPIQQPEPSRSTGENPAFHNEDSSHSEGGDGSSGASSPADEQSTYDEASADAASSSDSDAASHASTLDKEDETPPADHQEQDQNQDREDEEDQDEDDNETSSEVEDIDFRQFEKADLLSWMEEKAKLEEEDALMHYYKHVKDARARMDHVAEQERKQALERFIEEGGSEIDFHPGPDAELEAFYTAYKNFVDKRRKLIEERNAEKESNLKRKQEILEQLKELISSADTRESLDKLRELQEEWRQVGPVPPNEIHNLRQSYHFHLDQFYTNRSLNFELKELDRKKNLAQKQELVAQIRKLTELPDGLDAAKRLYKLQDEFWHLGPVPREHLDALMTSYREATQAVLQKRDAYLQQLDELRQQNYQAKCAILEKIREIAAVESQDPRVWIEKNKELGEWIEDWKKLGPSPKDKRKQLSADFREAVRQFNSRKNEFFKQRKKERGENLDRKKALIEEVEKLTQAEDIAAQRKRVLKIQDEWKTIGPAPPKQSEKVWKRFQSACDAYFNKLHSLQDSRKQEERDNLEKKQQLVQELEAMAEKEKGSLEQDADAIAADYRQRFLDIGFVPIKKKDAINKQFNQALTKMLRKHKDYGLSDSALVEYKMKLESLLHHNDGERKLQQEERRVQNEVKKLESEMETIENNLQFFSAQSKGGQNMRQQYEQKLHDLKTKIDFERKKHKLLRQMAG